MKVQTFKTAAIAMIAGAALATTGIAIGFRIAPLAHATAERLPAAVMVAPALKTNTRVLRYYRTEAGSVTLKATIQANESGWSVKSTCASKPVHQGGQCFIGASYEGSKPGTHEAVIIVRVTDDAGHVNEKFQPVSVYVADPEDGGRTSV